MCVRSLLLPPFQNFKTLRLRLLCGNVNHHQSPQIDLDAIKDSPSSIRMIERECRTMMSLSHPNIVRLQEVYRPRSGDRLYMVLDRLEGGSVDGLWRKQGKLSEDHAAHIILQVVSAVRYCHDRGIAVRKKWDLYLRLYLLVACLYEMGAPCMLSFWITTVDRRLASLQRVEGQSTPYLSMEVLGVPGRCGQRCRTEDSTRRKEPKSKGVRQVT